MLINRLYKSKNNPSNNKHLPKAEETNLLFYQTKKKSFREEETKKVLPLLAAPAEDPSPARKSKNRRRPSPSGRPLCVKRARSSPFLPCFRSRESKLQCLSYRETTKSVTSR
jgi:hypothetical protein